MPKQIENIKLEMRDGGSDAIPALRGDQFNFNWYINKSKTGTLLDNLKNIIPIISII
jgi:hypothetical protein